MHSFFRKDLLVLWRDRKEVIISVLSPIVIIIVLNFAFADLWFGDTAEETDIRVGLVVEDDVSQGLIQFEEQVETMQLSETEKETMIQQAAHLSPSGLLISFFSDSDLNSLIHTEQLDEDEAKEQVKGGDLDALVKIPEGFTFDVLRQIMFNESAQSSLIIQVEEQSMKSSTLQNILGGYMDTLNFQFALGHVTGG